MNRKGQALVEFVLILPILILILFSIVDFGNIFYSKYDLQNQSSDIIRLINEGKKIDEVVLIYNDFNIDMSIYKENYKLVEISRDVNIMSPVMQLVFSKNYKVSTKRVIVYEES